MLSTSHTCTLRGRRQNFTLAYDTGTAAFTAGKTLTGATSHATAIIVLTGSTASGTLTLHTITGTFQNDETISDNGTIPGAALVNGTIADAFDSNSGELTYTNVDTAAIACKFYNQKDTIRTSGQALFITSSTRLMLPATVTPAVGDEAISTNTGFVGTWTIGSTDPKSGPGGILHHWECDIAKAGA